MLPIRIETDIRQIGDEFVVEIPPVAMKVFHLRPGDHISFEPERLPSAFDGHPELRAAVDEVIEELREVSEYFAHYDATGEWQRPE